MVFYCTCLDTKYPLLPLSRFHLRRNSMSDSKSWLKTYCDGFAPRDQLRISAAEIQHTMRMEVLPGGFHLSGEEWDDKLWRRCTCPSSLTLHEINCEAIEKMHHSQAVTLSRKREHEDAFQNSSNEAKPGHNAWRNDNWAANVAVMITLPL